MPDIIGTFFAQYGELLLEGIWETLIMVAVSTALAYVIGVPLGVALIITQPQGIRPHPAANKDTVDNIVQRNSNHARNGRQGIAKQQAGDRRRAKGGSSSCRSEKTDPGIATLWTFAKK